MNFKRNKHITEPVKCYFCDNLTLYRVHGYPHYGRKCCKDCFIREKAEKEAYDAKWNDREESIAESMINHWLK